METPVKTKEVQWKGNTYTENLYQKDIDEIKHDAVTCKLNGYGESVFIEKLKYPYRRYWKDEVLKIFRDTTAEVKVGTPATENLYSDRRAKTVVEVISPRKIVVAENKTICKDYFAGNYDILDEINECIGTSIFTLRKGGGWYEEGQPKKAGSVTLTLGYRYHYIDPSF